MYWAMILLYAALVQVGSAGFDRSKNMRSLLSSTGATHLDVGSRQGGSALWVTDFLAARNIKATVVGLDLDPENVATCRRRGGKVFLLMFVCSLWTVRRLASEASRFSISSSTLGCSGALAV